MMDNEIVRIVFYSDSEGETEKVPLRSTERCLACQHETATCLTGDKVEGIGREAARAIGHCTDGRWYRGLISELMRLYPENIIEQVVSHHPGTVRSVLLARDIRERHAAD